MTTSRFIKLISVLSLISVFGCGQSEYSRLLTSELAKKGRKDSVLLGFNLTDSKQQFMDKCTALNKQKLVTMGPRGSVLYLMKDTVDTDRIDDIRLMIFPKYEDGKVISDIDVEFSYDAWAPWNYQYQADSLQSRLVELLDEWYGGNEFIYLTIDDKNVPVKIDNNRRIILKKKDSQVVVAKFQDITNSKFLGEKTN